MKIFDKKGMMIIPAPLKKEFKESEKILVVKECYCPNGHNLVNNRAVFTGYNGILLKGVKGENEGVVGLSPFFGDKSRIVMDIDLHEGDIPGLYCTICGTSLPSYANCDCGGQMITLFTSKELTFNDCIGICNRVGCVNSTIKNENELLTYAMINTL